MKYTKFTSFERRAIMGNVITFGNFKGGVGKTSSSAMVGYILSKKGKKVLLVDVDPQGNLTSLMLKTKQRLSNDSEVVMFDRTLMSAISEGDLTSIITSINDNLDLLPSYVDFTSYPAFLERLYPDSDYERALHFSKLLEPIKSDYDIVIIDVPPTVSIYTDSALMASDYTVVVLQTQERSLEGAQQYIVYLNELTQNYDASFDVLGILPVLLKNTSMVDHSVITSAIDEFGDGNMFKNVIKNMERIKRYDIQGIGDPDYIEAKTDHHDRRVFDVYGAVADEFLQRCDDLEGNE